MSLQLPPKPDLAVGDMFADATTGTEGEMAGNGVAAAVVVVTVCAGQTLDCTRYDCRTTADDLVQCRLALLVPRCSVDSHDYLMRLDKNSNSEESHCRDGKDPLHQLQLLLHTVLDRWRTFEVRAVHTKDVR